MADIKSYSEKLAIHFRSTTTTSQRSPKTRTHISPEDAAEWVVSQTLYGQLWFGGKTLITSGSSDLGEAAQLTEASKIVLTLIFGLASW